MSHCIAFQTPCSRFYHSCSGTIAHSSHLLSHTYTHTLYSAEESQRLLGVVDQDLDSEEETVFEIHPPPTASLPPMAPPLTASLPPTAPPLTASLPPTAPPSTAQLYNDPTMPATISTGLTQYPHSDMSLLPPPPDYTAAPMVPPKYTPRPGTALPVNIQMDGRLVAATLMQDVCTHAYTHTHTQSV